MRSMSALAAGPSLELIPIDDEIMGVVDGQRLADAFDAIPDDFVDECRQAVRVGYKHGSVGSGCQSLSRIQLLNAEEALSNEHLDMLVDIGVFNYEQDEFGEHTLCLVDGPNLKYEWLCTALLTTYITPRTCKPIVSPSFLVMVFVVLNRWIVLQISRAGGGYYNQIFQG